MPDQTLQQQRAAHALERVGEAAAQLHADEKRKFRSRSSELPFMIHANGLGQALAFFKSKNKDGYDLNDDSGLPARDGPKSKNKDGYDHLYSILSDWLISPGRPFAGHSDALHGVVACDRAVYMVAQAEANLLMDWVKQFADAFMDGDA